jgi:aspartate beta-hydroxylase
MDHRSTAHQALARGDRDAAAASFRQHLAQHPDDAEALAFLAHEADRVADWTAASALAARLAALEPRHPAPRVLAARAARQQGQVDTARALAREAIALDPGHFPGLLELAEAEQALGHREAALRAWMSALALAETHRARGVSRRAAEGLERAAAAVNGAMGEAVDAAIAPFEATHGTGALRRIRGAGDIFAGRRKRDIAHPEWRPGLMYIPGLEPRLWFEREQFDWVERVEAATDEVRAELLAVMEGAEGFAPYIDTPAGARGADYWAELNRSTDWSAFHFSRRGREFADNRRRCPRTAALLDSLPLMRVPGYAPEPMFSVLKPGTRIPPHHGSVNGRLTVHLPLIVPPDCGALKVGDEARPWVEGRIMVFDDAMLHEAWNHSAHTRVVLIFDVWNPQLDAIERDAFSALLQAAQSFERAASGAG